MRGPGAQGEKNLKRAYVIACDHLSLCKRTEKESTSQKLNSSLCRRGFLAYNTRQSDLLGEKKCWFIYMLNSTTFKLPLTNNSIARERKKMHFPLFQRETEQDRQGLS
jgi:hypothetical protein